jgi:hypothetical protein
VLKQSIFAPFIHFIFPRSPGGACAGAGDGDGLRDSLLASLSSLDTSVMLLLRTFTTSPVFVN